MTRAPHRHRRLTFRSRLRRGVLAVAVLGVCGAFGWAWWASTTTPSWWKPPDPAHDVVVDLGHATEMKVLEEVHNLREEADEWSLLLTDEQMNAWLAVNLPAWFEHETGEPWPQEIADPQVHAGEGVLTVGVRLPQVLGDRVLSLVLRPLVEPDGLRCQLVDASVGRFSLPGGVGAERALKWIRLAAGMSQSSEDLDGVLAFLNGETLVHPRLDLADRRCVRITGIDLSPGVMTLHCTTDPPPAREAPSTDDAR